MQRACHHNVEFPRTFSLQTRIEVDLQDINIEVFCLTSCKLQCNGGLQLNYMMSYTQHLMSISCCYLVKTPIMYLVFDRYMQTHLYIPRNIKIWLSTKKPFSYNFKQNPGKIVFIWQKQHKIIYPTIVKAWFQSDIMILLIV